MQSIIEFDIHRTSRICPGCRMDYLYIMNGKINTCPQCGYYELLKTKGVSDYNNVTFFKYPPPFIAQIKTRDI